MKRIAILTCPKSETVCTGAACFFALNHRTHAFTRYQNEEVEVEAFMKCSGCGHFPQQDKGLDEKIERIIDAKPDAVHVGICCCVSKTTNLCPEVKAICKRFDEAGISIIHGTHSVF